MCGICLERLIVGLIDQAGRGDAETVDALAEMRAEIPTFLWMETENLVTDLRQQQDGDRQIGDDENTIIFLRLVEMLCLDGFESPTYQKLIKEPTAVRAVEVECAEEKRKRFKALALISPKCGGEFFFDSATFLTAEGFARLHSGRDLLALAGEEALAWFLDEFMVEEDSEIKWSPPRIQDDLKEKFLLLSRLVVAGITSHTGRHRRRSLLERLLLGYLRYGSPRVDEISLWLQRRAFLLHAQRHPEWVETYHSPARPILYGYFAAMTGLAMEKRHALATEIEDSLRQRDLWEFEGEEVVDLLRGQ